MFHSAAVRRVKNLALLGIVFLIAHIVAAQNFQTGSSNTVTADPPVSRPHVKPCVVTLFSGLQFVDFSVPTHQYQPPSACPGPWQKVVFTADFSVTAGRQFDRTAIVDMSLKRLLVCYLNRRTNFDVGVDLRGDFGRHTNATM